MAISPLGVLERTGHGVHFWIFGVVRVLRLIGACTAWCLTGWAFGQPVRLAAIYTEIFEFGVKSLPLTGLFAFSFGSVIGLQVDLMLERVDYLPPILGFVGDFFTRQQAPVIVGILLAARVGGAFTSELSAMVIDGEVAALKSMGIDPVRFIVAPAFIAMAIATPLLTLLMIAAQIFTLGIYLHLAQGTALLFVLDLVVSGITAGDLVLGISKGLLYGMIILGISAQTSLSVLQRGRRTGSATTFAVVTSITAVLLCDALISILL